MNPFLKLLFICIIIALPAIACCQNTLHTTLPAIKLTRDNPGKKLFTCPGQKIILTLADHVDGGYRFDKPKYKTSILRLIKHWNGPPAANSRLGEAGKTTWQFITLKKGCSALKITGTRPWKGGGSIIIFSGIVIVK